ncbi:MAG: hypothetical protein AAF509_17675 [Pseudomonadota bacterium]
MTVGLIAWAWPGETVERVEERIAARSLGEQALIVCLILALLFLGMFASAQLGWLGVLGYLVFIAFVVG